MTLLIWLITVTTAVVAYRLGRVHERHLADAQRADEAETRRILHRPEVTVTDGGWVTGLEPADVLAFRREVLLDDEPHGRHDHRIAIGTSAQRARCHTITHQFHLLVGGTWSAAERAELEEAVT